MEESLKNRLIIILTILSAIFFLGTLKSCDSARRERLARDKEMGRRMDLEEKASSFAQEKMVSDNELKSATSALEEEKAAHQATKKALLQEQLVNQSLKEELQKLSKLKEALEEDLKDALIKDKNSRVKK
ncbi:MAG: hypothetical protein WC321_01580 [Candidatus Omnitrophota bacterium]|jgi:small-conductance mechanosensitive channel